MKDSIDVEAHMGAVEIEFTAANPGDWCLHCHKPMHMEGGMIALGTTAGGPRGRGKRAIGGMMTHRMHRRRFLWYLTAGAGVAVAGSALVQITSAPADPPLRRAPNGDPLETVPQGHLPSFAQQASP